MRPTFVGSVWFGSILRWIKELLVRHGFVGIGSVWLEFWCLGLGFGSLRSVWFSIADGAVVQLIL